MERLTPLKRIESGIGRLDYILKGGFLEGGVYVIYGPPGSGKTIFANQTCFNHLRRQQGSCIYMTLLAESHARMLVHLQSFSFFDASFIPNQMTYLSGLNVLEKQGLAGLLNQIQQAVRDHGATLLVIDGLETIADAAESIPSFRIFIHDLQAAMGLLRCTTLLLSGPRGVGLRPENTLVEGVIELIYQLVGPRAIRELVVHKFRGTAQLLGKHALEITDKGVAIHPRTEIQFATPREMGKEKRIRMKFGIPALDEMLHGGVLSGSSTTLLGAPGTGKTILGTSFLVEGARHGQLGIYFGFNEPPAQLLDKAAALGLPLEKYVNGGLIEILWQAPIEHFMDSMAEALLERIRDQGLKKTRVFIDGIEGFQQAAVYLDRMPRFFSALINQLRILDVTTMISAELPLFNNKVEIATPEICNAIENVIVAKYVEHHSQLFRLISIMKMRESDFDSSIREFHLTSHGFEVAESFKSAEDILVGQTRINKTRRAG